MAVGRSDDASQWQKIFRFVELAGPLSCPAGTPGREVCDQELWSGIQTQFGANGPACGAPPPDTVPPPQPGGCCDAGDGSPVGAGLLALLVTWALGRRRGTAPPRRGPLASV
jgi:hypothetical protein